MKIKTNDIDDLKIQFEDKKLFIFDFDGTLANTELFHWEAYNECLKEFEVSLTEKDIQKYVGNKEIRIYNMIKEDFNIEFDGDKFFNRRISIYFDLVKRNKLKPYDFFNQILNTYPDIQYTIVSSQKAFVIEELLNIWGLRDCFSKIISVADSNIEKNDVYSNTLTYFNTTQLDSVLFEDSNKYLKMGMDNNILSIGIETEYNASLLIDCDVILKV